MKRNNMMTTKQVCEKLGITRQLLFQWRTGYVSKRKSGKIKLTPQLIEGKDYFWVQGKLLYIDAVCNRSVIHNRKEHKKAHKTGG